MTIAPEDRGRCIADWQSADSAPVNVFLLVKGNGGVRFALLDRLGQWRRWSGRPCDTAPTHWAFPPE